MRCAFRFPTVSCVLAGASALLAICGSAVGGGVAGPLPNRVAAGDVTQTSAVMWARSSVGGTITFEVATDAAFTSIFFTQTVPVGTPMLPGKLNVSNLNPGTQYFYRATDSALNSSTGTFRTPHAAGMNGFRMGVSGDWRGEMIPYPAAKNIPARDLDLWVALGDTIYGDVGSPAVPGDATSVVEFRLKHDEVMTDRAGLNTIADARASTALLAVIDDHEVTNDFSGGAHPSTDPRFAPFAGDYINETGFFLNGIQAFHEYHPINAEVYGATGDPRTAGKTKLYRSRTYGQDAAVIVTDARTFRDTGLPAANPLDPNSVLAFLVGSFNPARTMMGQAQLQDIFADLSAAQAAGVTWKFVMVPEPTQNFGVFAGSDRYEGFAAERTALLKFIYQNDITNVVFVCADIHGTVVNNLTYENGPGFPKVRIPAFEISTGSVSYDAPFGPTVAFAAFGLGLPGTIPLSTYFTLPPVQQEGYVQALINGLLSPLGYDAVGLQGSAILSTQVVGGSTATNTYGWTEFDIDAATQALTITTYGVPYYPASAVQADPVAIGALTPSVVQQFRVIPQPPTCRGDTNSDRVVNTLDLVALLGSFGQSVLDGTRGDITRNGVVDMNDLTVLLGNFGVSCP